MGAVDVIEWARVFCGRHIQNDSVSREYSSNFVLSLNIPTQKLFRWFRRPQLWAIGDWQLHHNTPAHASHLLQSFLAKHQITQVTQPPTTQGHPYLAPCNFWLFPKLKSPLKRKRFQIIDEIQENTIKQLMAVGRTVWGPTVPTLQGTESALSYVQCFLYLVSSSINVSIFHSIWLGTFWTDLVCRNTFNHPGWCGSVDWVLACEPRATGSVPS